MRSLRRTARRDRRRATVVVAASLAAVVIALWIPVPRAAPYTDDLVVPVLALLVALYALGRHGGVRATVAGASAAACLLVVAGTIGDGGGGGAFVGAALSTAVLVLGPVLIGRFVRIRAALRAALRRRAVELERSRAARAEQAAADERARVADELHDVVAHALGAMTVQAAAARRMAADEAERARAAFASIESAGRDALDEIRRLHGVLHREDADLALAPLPSLRHVGALARQATAAGLRVELSVRGDVAALPAGVDLTAYRVVQAALAGALDGAGAGSALVRVRREADALTVEVADDGPGSDGPPLRGMRARVAVHGGQLVTAPHHVRARLPLTSAA